MKKEVIEYVGLIPAGGKATRISPIPCSKEIFPVGFEDIMHNGKLYPKVAAHYLLEKIRLAGVEKTYFVLSKGKWDIPAYFGSGSIVNMALAYLITELTYGVPFTIDSAFPFLESKRVLFGFPDILFKPHDSYTRLIERMNARKADIVLGLFLADKPEKMDMVDLKTDGTIQDIHVKPLWTNLKWTWIIAVWNHVFTEFMHEFVCNYLQNNLAAKKELAEKKFKEVFVGDVIREAIGSKLKVDQVMFPQGKYIDIGTPEDMIAAVQNRILQL